MKTKVNAGYGKDSKLSRKTINKYSEINIFLGRSYFLYHTYLIIQWNNELLK